MGREIVRLIAASGDLALGAAIDRAGSPQLGRDAGALAGTEALGVPLRAELSPLDVEVLVDFSAPAACVVAVEAAAEAGVACVVGTTGLDAAAKNAIERAASRVPIVLSPNMSVGVAAALRLLALATELLGADYDVEIVEMHHRAKLDAPSGTALRMAEVIAQKRGVDLGKVAKHGRSGQQGVRGRDEIGILALRGGDVVGEHTVVFAGPGERIEITHRAHTRETFARGALRAARWVAGKPPRLYGMADVLGGLLSSRSAGREPRCRRSRSTGCRCGAGRRDRLPSAKALEEGRQTRSRAPSIGRRRSPR